jgi:hypothetical protein
MKNKNLVKKETCKILCPLEKLSNTIHALKERVTGFLIPEKKQTF